MMQTQCPGVGTISIFGAITAIAAAFGGVAKAVRGSLLTASNGTNSDPTSILHAEPWVLGGIVVAWIVALVEHGHRCIGCDTRR